MMPLPNRDHETAPRPLSNVGRVSYVSHMSTQTSQSLPRVDAVVRRMHAEREGHAAEGYWTGIRYSANGKTMLPNQLILTCCGMTEDHTITVAAGHTTKCCGGKCWTR